MLAHDRRRLALSVAGAAFAVLTVLVQLGVRDALLDSAVELVEQLRADVVLISAARESVSQEELRLPAPRLHQARGVEGVEWSGGLVLEKMLWKRPDGTEGSIRVIGVDPDDHALSIAGLAEQAQALASPGAALFDLESRRSFGFAGLGPAEVSGRRVEVVGTVRLGTDFAVDGNLVVSHATYHRLTGRAELAGYDLGLLRVAPGADVGAVVSALRGLFSTDVGVYSKRELVEREMAYWRRRTPIGPAFAIGAVMGFLVGVAILFQILFTEVSDHLKQLAALKAIGYENLDLRLLVLLEALLLATAAFIVAVAVGLALFSLLGAVTGLPLSFGLGRGLELFVLSLAMGAVPAMIAVRKLTEADPAELFE